MGMKKLQFPEGFIWGTATSSYQIEGAADEDREPSIWDRFCAINGNVTNGDTGAVACDHYHRFRSDVTNLIKPLNTKYYRFSIAWPRIQRFDSATGEAKANEAGIAFYNALIDVLLELDVTPVVTLYHWDLPTAVDDRYGGWMGDKEIAVAFACYAETCFRSFGDRVRWWLTLNEPLCSALLGYETGEHAPGYTKEPGVAAYLAGHNLLLAHGHAVRVYREQFQSSQRGSIGITLNAMWFEPRNAGDERCIAAAQRAVEFELGWFANPIYCNGDYPKAMRDTVGDRLPTFTKEERQLLQGSSDFFGLNHYSALYATGFESDEEVENGSGGTSTPAAGTAMERRERGATSYFADRGVRLCADDDWKQTDMGWHIVPWGLQRLLEHIHTRYSPPGGITVMENGLAVAEPSLSQALRSDKRVDFYSNYLAAVHAAIHGEVKADVRGYFLWSLMDNFEWSFGYGKRFGIYYVDFNTQERMPKPAVQWYANVVKENALTL